MTSPKTKSGDLLSRIGSLQTEAFDDLAVARMEREARSLLGVDALGAHLALGALASIRFDADAVRQHFAAAGQLSSRDETVAAGHAIALQQMGLFAEAFPLALQASEWVPENLTHLRRALQYALFAGRIQDATMLAETLTKRTAVSEAMAELPGDVRRVLALRGVPESEFSGGVRTACQVLHDHRIRHTSILVEVNESPDEQTVACVISIDGDIPTALELGDELAIRLSEQFPDWHPWALIFDYSGRLPA